MVDFSQVTDVVIPEGVVTKIEAGGDILWEKKIPEENPLCFTAEQANSTVGYEIIGSLPDIRIQYSYNKRNWVDWDGSDITLTNIGDKIYVHNKQSILSLSYLNRFTFKMTGKIAASGNCNSMINYDAITTYCYYSLFENCLSLTQAPELPATILAGGCYYAMFRDCSSLIKAPELPAIILTPTCYSDMFYGCTSLTQAPKLPATSLNSLCYYGMFKGCISLTQAPELPATILTNRCYSDMFYGCSSLTQAPELPTTTLADTCYDSMFEGCTSLTQAPELPATSLNYSCYNSMFKGCISLTQAPELPATTLADTCYDSMFSGCTSLKIRTKSGTKIFTCPSTSGLYHPVLDMFYNTGGEFTGTPTEGVTYYYY